MHQVNVRGTFLTSKHCIPHLRASKFGGKILNNSPPLVMSSRWFAPHVAYTMTKFGMSMCALGMAEEFRSENIAVNTIWPKTMIATAATEMLAGDEQTSKEQSRSPAIMADAVYAILCRPNSFTGNFCIDEEVLRQEGESTARDSSHRKSAGRYSVEFNDPFRVTRRCSMQLNSGFYGSTTPPG